VLRAELRASGGAVKYGLSEFAHRAVSSVNRLVSSLIWQVWLHSWSRRADETDAQPTDPCYPNKSDNDKSNSDIA
jgi:hypothetical protein